MMNIYLGGIVPKVQNDFYNNRDQEKSVLASVVLSSF